MNPETIDRCLDSLRPYHGILLLIEPLDLLESLGTDASPALRRLIQMYNPLKSLQTLAADSDLSLAQVFQLTGHLVYWAKATIIYPLCESNVYVVCPDALISNQLMESFSEQFPGLSLMQVDFMDKLFSAFMSVCDLFENASFVFRFKGTPR